MMHGTSPNQSLNMRLVQYLKASSRKMTYESDELGKQRLRRRSLRLWEILRPMIDSGALIVSDIGKKLFALDIISSCIDDHDEDDS
jgi:hypothetical protein